MASHPRLLLHLRLFLFLGAVLGNAGPGGGGGAEASDRAEPDPYSILTWHDYSPPSPPPPLPPPVAPAATCAEDLHGKGDFRTRCEVSEEVELDDDVYITGNGSLVLLAGASLTCEKAGCVISANLSGETQEDSWGGDAYAWSDLEHPLSYGSKGGSTSVEKDYGGAGGGIVWLFAKDLLMNGTVLADGGASSEKGGGGSGGSIYIKAATMHGGGKISASGGDGLAGGGGGRVSINVFSRHDDTQIFVHDTCNFKGGRSSGCPDNAGAAGTLYEAVPKSLVVSNNNLSTQTDTLLLEFPNQPLWTNVFVRNHAKVAVPLLWSRVQVQGQLSLLTGAVLTFGLTRYPYSEFELMAEELLMSDSTIKVFGALRMSVKMLLMWNSRMLIDGGRESLVATSLLDASNLIVLKESSVIHSNANLGVRGQGLLNLAPKLNCEDDSCPVEIVHPPEDCNLNSSLSFTLQVCRVEDIDVWGLVQGTVIHFNRARSVIVHTSGIISASGLGCRTGVGQGKILSSGISGGGGHGGKGGDGVLNGSLAEGGPTYGDADLPCELGSGSGNDTTGLSTAGGGIIVMGSWEYSLPSLALYGSVESNGGSYADMTTNGSIGGPGGGSGGTILLFVHTLSLAESSLLSSVGGLGSSGSGGGGGGRIHFHWSNIPTGETILLWMIVRGGVNGQGFSGGNGTITGKACPKGLYGTFCKECPLGTYKNVTGSSKSLCFPCPPEELPHRAIYISVRGLLILLALVLSVARMKFVGTDELPGPAPTQQGSQIDHSFPFLESLNEVLETNRAEESHGHVHRMYFMGPNTFSEPWHLPHTPPEEITEIVYFDSDGCQSELEGSIPNANELTQASLGGSGVGLFPHGYGTVL
ncbi:hypothetical protein PR202_ga23214 [Eleusine coracana subsp. coracana]|uniref:DUF8003 domain-containing protein n=1 Tax=Eleusine coracana subsp. coracana TaxID=191504 RepID=A0AAV5D5Y1_ELECO|nr:hypothetical protein PR202_ga23214 [Eleusine coracana subsp. coracana]